MSDDYNQAFPRPGNEWSDMAWVPAPANQGMSMLQYYAAKAMQAIIATDVSGSMGPRDVANLAFEYAREMAEADDEYV